MAFDYMTATDLLHRSEVQMKVKSELGSLPSAEDSSQALLAPDGTTLPRLSPLLLQQSRANLTGP